MSDKLAGVSRAGEGVREVLTYPYVWGGRMAAVGLGVLGVIWQVGGGRGWGLVGEGAWLGGVGLAVLLSKMGRRFPTRYEGKSLMAFRREARQLVGVNLPVAYQVSDEYEAEQRKLARVEEAEAVAQAQVEIVEQMTRPQGRVIRAVALPMVDSALIEGGQSS